MRIKQRETDGVVVLEISGDMHGGPENVELVNVLDRLGKEGRLDTVLDLKKVGFVASNGLGILIRARAHYTGHGGRLRICNVSTRIQSLITVTRLNTIFDVSDSCAEALRTVKS